MGKKNLYTIVTNDEYEIPIKCDLKVSEAAEFLRTEENNVRRMLIRPWKKSKYKVVLSGSVKYDSQEYAKARGIKNISECADKNGEKGVGYRETFSAEWDNAVYRLQSSGVDLDKIEIVGKQVEYAKGNYKRD